MPIDWELNQRIEQETTNNSDENNCVLTCLQLPDFVDLSLWCSPIEDQGSINSCTAHAGVALTEYFAKRAFGKYTDVSPLFLYKTARNLMQRAGDSGASVRETMKAMVLFGIPPEEHWPYDEERYDEEPTTFCYSFAKNYQALKYFRLDYAGIAENALLIQIKAVLLAGFPCMFGFTVYTSIYEEANFEKGYIPYPSKLDKMEGGHAVVAVGYDDNLVIMNADGKRSKGAVLIRNSWGIYWGQGGYGWLPYDYILAGLTADWWSLLKSEWFESGQFGIGATHWKSGMGRRGRRGKRTSTR
ncbi:MAG: cysteine protease [Leptolyngbya sp. SIO3F4]|nr:cysteine protease [Leptolyngbya sp. SIO3F4]